MAIAAACIWTFSFAVSSPSSLEHLLNSLSFFHSQATLDWTRTYHLSLLLLPQVRLSGSIAEHDPILVVLPKALVFFIC
jgi:hypothetical protein